MANGGSRRPVGRFEGAGGSQEDFLEDKLQGLGSERTDLLGGAPWSLLGAPGCQQHPANPPLYF